MAVGRRPVALALCDEEQCSRTSPRRSMTLGTHGKRQDLSGCNVVKRRRPSQGSAAQVRSATSASPRTIPAVEPHSDPAEQGATADDCPFCRIVRGGDDAAVVVARAEDWLAFFPDTPATPGHTLVVPKRHVQHYWALDAGLACTLAVASLRVGLAIQDALAPEGMNLITSRGQAAEQTVQHVHLHLVPRWREDALDEIWPPRRETDSATLTTVAERIRVALGTP
jgi:histidine triad (HIT) family protein